MTTERSIDWTIIGGRVLRSDGFEDGEVAIREGRIDVRAAPQARCFEVQGCLVLPGIVDLHGDGFEHALVPRPKVSMASVLALAEADRQMIANGITTGFHGISAAWEPGLRSVESAGRLLADLEASRSVLDCDTRVNLRWETFCVDSVDEVASWLDGDPTMLLSLNDHLSALVGLEKDAPKIVRIAERCGLSRKDCKAMLDALTERADEVPEAVCRLTATARAQGRTIFAHDERSPEERLAHRTLGVNVSEFPMTTQTAEAAISAGEATVLGAPNVLRGGSQNNAIDAEPAIRAGLCSALASDYYYPAPLAAAFDLADRGVMDLAEAWGLVSAAPARIAGLTDRGNIAAGTRADLIVVEPRTRRVRAVFVNGRKVLERD